MSLKSFFSRKTDTLGYGVACIGISAVISLLFSLITINSSTTKELKAALFKEEIPLLNRVSSIWSECSLYEVVTIAEHHRIETQPVLYVDQEGNVVGRDTLKRETVTADTLSVYIPAFAYKAESYATVQEHLEYIRGNLDKLSPETYDSIMELLVYLDDYPIVWVDNEQERLKGIWSKQDVYSGFFDRIGSIYTAFLRRQRKFL